METPEAVELRKRSVEAEMEDTEVKPLYRVVPQKSASVGGAMMGSQHVYDLKGAVGVGMGGRGGAQGECLMPAGVAFTRLLPTDVCVNLRRWYGNLSGRPRGACCT